MRFTTISNKLRCSHAWASKPLHPFTRKRRTRLALSVLCWVVASTLGASAQTNAKACSNIGDTVTVRGHADAFVNGGTYFVLLKPLCVRYPKPTDHFSPINLETIGEKLPPADYLEVTGELSDPWPLVGVGIKVKTFRNVDADVKAELADWLRLCKEWQDERIPALTKRMHGAQVARQTDDTPFSSKPGHRCGIGAADTQLPHEVATIWRPE